MQKAESNSMQGASSKIYINIIYLYWVCSPDLDDGAAACRKMKVLVKLKCEVSTVIGGREAVTHLGRGGCWVLALHLDAEIYYYYYLMSAVKDIHTGRKAYSVSFFL